MNKKPALNEMVRQVNRCHDNPENSYLRTEEKEPRQELVELRASLKATNEEKKTLKYLMRIIQE